MTLITSLSKNGYSIEKTELNENIIKKLKEKLTVKSNQLQFINSIDNNEFTVFKENEKKLYIPKYLGLSEFGEPLVNKIKEGNYLNSFIKFEGELRDYQIEPINKYLKAINNPRKRGGILQLPPGWGKTVMGLYIITKLKKKTLIIVHKDFLLKQWCERIEQYIPNAQIGIIKQNKFEVEDSDIVIASLQTICARKMEDDYGFGLVIVDECHHMGAKVFSKALHKMNFEYSLGLSATVNRIDGLTKVFKWFLGDIVFKAINKQESEVKVIMNIFENDDLEYCNPCILYNRNVNVPKMINNICGFLKRTEFILEFVCNNILKKEPNRNVLFLSDRRQHLEVVSDLLKKYNYSEKDYGFYIGGMKNNSLIESESKQILLGTYNMVSEGFDLPKLNTLIMLSPKGDVEQSVGRIQRQLVSEREYIPLIYDIVDNFSIFKNQAKKRYNFYKKTNYNIEGDYKPIQKDNFELIKKSYFI